jgi:RNA-directed DNA polymerase
MGTLHRQTEPEADHDAQPEKDAEPAKNADQARENTKPHKGCTHLIGIIVRSTYPKKCRHRHFLGHTIRRQRQRGSQKRYVYTHPSRKAIQSIKDKTSVKTYRNTRNQDLDELINSLNQSLRGWANYFRHGVAKKTFNAVDNHAWNRLMRWIRRKYEGRHRLSMPELRRRFCDVGWRFAHNGVVFVGASSVAITRYRYRGSNIPTPWTSKPAAANG